jgi:hypothetical protein
MTFFLSHRINSQLIAPRELTTTACDSYMTNNERRPVYNTVFGEYFLGYGLEFAHNHTFASEKDKKRVPIKIPHVKHAGFALFHLFGGRLGIPGSPQIKEEVKYHKNREPEDHGKNNTLPCRNVDHGIACQPGKRFRHWLTIECIIKDIFQAAEGSYKKGSHKIQAILPGAPEEDCAHYSVSCQGHEPAGVIEVRIPDHVVGLKNPLPDQNISYCIKNEGNNGSDDGAKFFHK